VYAAGDVRDGSLSIIATALADGGQAEAHAVQFVAALMARKKKPFFQRWIKELKDYSDNPVNGRVAVVVNDPCGKCLEYSQVRDAKAR